MGLFKKKSVLQSYDKENKKPVIKASICSGEQVAGFKDIHTGKIEEVMLIKSSADLEKLYIEQGLLLQRDTVILIQRRHMAMSALSADRKSIPHF